MPIDFEKEVAVKGRELKKPYVVRSTFQDRVILVINDEERPEFWASITLTRNALTVLMLDMNDIIIDNALDK